MKHLIHHVKKHSKRVVRHLNTHKHKYLFGTFGTFGTFAIFKTFLLLIGFFGTLHIANIFAADIEVNSGNIVSEYGCATDANSCNLSNKGINSIAPDTFVNHTNLQYLYLHSNQISSIEAGVFDGLTNLTTLGLVGNQISSIEAGVFAGLTNLQQLYLYSNQISSIEAGVFDGLTNLNYLDLHFNQISSIDSGDFDGLTNLQYLNLDSNQISSIDSGVFAGLTNLQQLGLDFNQISSIDSGVFDGLTNLTTLYLHSNQISSIDSGVFAGLSNLQQLGLGGNQISSIEAGVFDGLTNLNYLGLGGSQISSIEAGVFDGLNNLQTLDLGGNQISSISEDIMNLANLQDGNGLNIYNNKINYNLLSKSLLSFIDAKHVTWMGDRRATQTFEAVCGNGTIEDEEMCDDGDANGTPNHCSSSCTMPIVGNLEILGTPKVGETVRGSYTYSYEESAEGHSTYQRYRGIDEDFQTIPGATGIDYVVTSRDAGKYIALAVTPISESGVPGNAEGSDGVFIATLPISAAGVIITGTANVGETLTGEYTYQKEYREILGQSFSSDEEIRDFTFDSNDVPYIRYGNNNDRSSSILNFTGGARQQLGSAFTNGWVNYLMLDSNDVPYIMYRNENDKSSSIWNFTDGARQQLGSAFNGNVDYLLLDSNDVPYIMYRNDNDGSSSIRSYTGGSRSQLGQSFSSDEEIRDFTFDSNDVPYIMYGNNNDRSSSILNFTGGARQQLGSGFTNGWVNYLMLDSNDVPYIMYRNENDKSSSILNFTDGARQQLGSAFNGNVDYLLLDSNDVPYIMYRNDNDRSSSILNFTDGARQQLGESFTNGDISKGGFMLDSNDVPYIMYRNENDKSSSIWNFTDGARQQLGSAFNGNVNYLMLDSNDVPYIMYRNKNHGSSSILMLTQNPAEGTSRYQRYRDGEMIAGATSPTYKVTTGDQGKHIIFEVTPISTEQIEGAPIESEAKLVNSFPVASDVTITGEAAIGSVLTGSYTHSDVDGNRESILTNSTIRDMKFSSEGSLYALVGSKPGDRVMKFENNQWTSVGNLFESQINSFFLDKQNSPYAIVYGWNDELQSDIQTVIKLDGNDWVSVGSFFTGGISEIKFDGTDTPYLVNGYYDYDLQASLYSVVRFDGESRTRVGSSFTEGIDLYMDNNGIPYVSHSYYNKDIETYLSEIMKLEEGTWVRLGDPIKGGTMVFGADNAPYLLLGGKENGSVVKFDGTGWIQIGGAIEGEMGTLVLDSHNVPYVLFWNNEGGNIIQLEGENRALLGEPMDFALGDFSIGANDVPYIMGAEKGAKKGDSTVTVLRFEGNSRTNVGPSLSSDAKSRLLPSNDGTLYVRLRGQDRGQDIVNKFTTDTEAGSSYQRYSNGEKIEGATGLSYLVTTSDAGKIITFGVRPAAANGSSPGLEQKSSGLSIAGSEGNNTDVGGGGGSITKDVCAHMDCSSSYYDQTCGVCPSKPSTGAIHQAPSKIGDITNSPYSTELNSAYLRAYNFGITTMPTIQQANIEGNLIRSHMAKMMVEFATLFDRKINTGANCSFTDMRKQSDEMKYYSTLACQLGLMGLDDNGNPAEKFNPSDTVTRAQFGTALSRLLYGHLNNAQKGTEWYTQHLQALNNAGIMKKIDDPMMKELRGYVMLMMMRAAK